MGAGEEKESEEEEEEEELGAGEEAEEDKEEEEEEEEGPAEKAKDEDIEAEFEARKNGKEWYKKKHCFGIKQKFAGRRQILSLGSPANAAKQMSKAALEKLACRVIKKMEHEGMTEENAKIWAKDQIISCCA